MTADQQERVYFVGGTGNSGTNAVKELLKKKIPVTLYSRSPEKAQNLFGSLVTKDESPSLLNIIQGDLDDLTPFEASIQGHTRLFIVVNDFAHLASLTVAIAQKAYAAGIKQIVHISSVSAGYPWRSFAVGQSHRSAEEGILAIPNRGSYVVLRPSRFMSNTITFQRASIQQANVVFDIADPDIPQQWISNNDIGLVVANIFKEPIEKHQDAVYELVGDVVTPTSRVAYLSEALGRPIKYVKKTAEEYYDVLTQQANLPHLIALDLVKAPDGKVKDQVTPGISILLGRQPETLEHWTHENKAALL
ncbi:hypothetical protein BDA99DRAFT_545580 [Phascolomyces articulosus]|uniref:NmrA-like domain-containing protein n=1 Tax=Phascolomyces articulosus TaxID=60185 RepID=A0AAD5K955_9FUNG|nr:hypothetical protein BDA99DRAFT_545580 [Phascolomyces articulosus]